MDGGSPLPPRSAKDLARTRGAAAAPDRGAYHFCQSDIESRAICCNDARAAGNLGPQLPAAQQDKTVGQTELPHHSMPY